MCCPVLSPPKPLDQSKNVTVRTYHNLREEKNGRKKLAKKCQKEPKFVFWARAPLPACWPEGPAAGATKAEAPRLPAEGRQAIMYIFEIKFLSKLIHSDRKRTIGNVLFNSDCTSVLT